MTERERDGERIIAKREKRQSLREMKDQFNRHDMAAEWFVGTFLQRGGLAGNL